jgi:iron complex outermembrane receptor protein
LSDLKFIFHFSKLFFIFLFFSLSINAEENSIFNLPEIFVTNTRTNIGLAGSSTKVYSQDYISNSTATNLAELMGNIAGIQYRDMFGGPGQIEARIDMRGFGATGKSNTLIMINGRKLNDLDMGGLSWDLIPAETIEKIEVIPGNAGSVLYGDGAVGGVINIITTNALSKINNRFTTTYGSHDHFQENITLHKRFGNFGVMINGDILDNNNYRRNNKHEQYTLNSEIRYKLLKGELYLYSNFNRDYHGLPGHRVIRDLEGTVEHKTDRLSAVTPADWGKENNIAITLGGIHNFNDIFGMVLDGHYTVKDQDSYFVGNTNHITDTVLRHYSFTPRFTYDYQLKNMPLKNIFGIDINYADYSSDRKASVHVTQTKLRHESNQLSVSLYSQNSVSLSDNINLSGGLRFQRMLFNGGTVFYEDAEGDDDANLKNDTISQSDNRLGANIGVEYFLQTNFSIFGRTARSFRIANIDDRIGADGTSMALKPQMSYDFEIGTLYENNKLSVQSSIYLMSLRNEIQFNSSNSKNLNLGRTRRYGFENSVIYNLNNKVSMDTNISVLRSEFLDNVNTTGPYDTTDEDIPLVANFTANSSLYFKNLFNKKINFTTTARFVGKKNKENDQNNIETAIPSYYLLDLKLGGIFLSYNWNLKANNVLGNEYNNYGVSSNFCQQGFGDFCKRESYYPMPEQTFTFSLSRDF